MILVYTLVAYAIAIALKYAVQIPTITAVQNQFGLHSVQIGFYYGLQTVAFEVGLAYVVAWYGVSHGKLEMKDAEAYGAGLAFWENAILLGALTLLDYVALYSLLSTNSSIAQTVYDQLQKSAPGLFAPSSQAIVSVAYGTLERFSSIIIHVAWGYLCFMAAYYHREKLFLLALPMGLIDFLVPFAPNLGLPIFESVVFLLSVLSLAVAWYATRDLRKTGIISAAVAQS